LNCNDTLPLLQSIDAVRQCRFDLSQTVRRNWPLALEHTRSHKPVQSQEIFAVEAAERGMKAHAQNR
jgi:hypothetical protein